AFPKGIINTTEVSMKEVAIQLRVIASIENSLPMAGNAIFTDEPMNAVMKPVTIDMASAPFCSFTA
ncbi:MAG: hypothetical protein ACYC9O_16040, partial [Candidatus Latescibacterota bacterium]